MKFFQKIFRKNDNLTEKEGLDVEKVGNSIEEVKKDFDTEINNFVNSFTESMNSDKEFTLRAEFKMEDFGISPREMRLDDFNSVIEERIYKITGNPNLIVETSHYFDDATCVTVSWGHIKYGIEKEFAYLCDAISYINKRLSAITKLGGSKLTIYLSDLVVEDLIYDYDYDYDDEDGLKKLANELVQIGKGLKFIGVKSSYGTKVTKSLQAISTKEVEKFALEYLGGIALTFEKDTDDDED